MKRKLANTLWFALVCAKEERQGLVDAYSGDNSQEAVRNALADIKAFEALQMKLFGSTETAFNRETKTMKTVSVYDLSRLVKENPELFEVHTDEG